MTASDVAQDAPPMRQVFYFPQANARCGWTWSETWAAKCTQMTIARRLPLSHAKLENDFESQRSKICMRSDRGKGQMTSAKTKRLAHISAECQGPQRLPDRLATRPKEKAVSYFFAYFRMKTQNCRPDCLRFLLILSGPAVCDLRG
jgi:hypothetical protein